LGPKRYIWVASRHPTRGLNACTKKEKGRARSYEE
jgi:hypothetical protein